MDKEFVQWREVAHAMASPEDHFGWHRRPCAHGLVVAGHHGRVRHRHRGRFRFRGRYVVAVCVAALFFSIPFLVGLPVPWEIFGPMVFIGLGVVVLVKAF